MNHILPYAAPTCQAECGREAALQLSRTCLECARDVLSTLEQEYLALYGRNLTLSRLPEAVILPLCPDKGTCLGYDPNLSASVYLENDLSSCCGRCEKRDGSPRRFAPRNDSERRPARFI